MPTEQVVINVGKPECDPQKPAECTNNTHSFNLSPNAPESGHQSPDCANFLPLAVAAGLAKGFLWIVERRNKLSPHGKVDYFEK